MEVFKSICFVFVLIHLSLSDDSVSSKATNKRRTDDKVEIYDTQVIIVTCGVKPYEEQDYPQSDINFLVLFVDECNTPEESYASVLRKHNYKNDIRKLSHHHIPYDNIIKAKHVEGFNLTEVNLRGVSAKKLVRISSDFLEAISNAETLHFENVVIETIPDTTKATSVYVNLGKFEGNWEGCESLKNLMLSQVEVPGTKNWLAKCTKLENIVLDRMPSVDSLRWVLQGATALTDLKITDSDIKLLPTDLLSSAVNLQDLKLISSNIENLERFGNLTKLTKIDFTMNPLKDRAFNMKFLSELPALGNLDLTGAHLPNFCNHFDKSMKFNKTIDGVDKAVEPLNVHSLHLVGTGMTRFCFANWPLLKYLNVYNNNISVLDFRQLPLNKPGRIIINLYGNPIRQVVFDENDYDFFKSRVDIARFMVAMDFTLDCDCHGAWFNRATRDFVITAIQAGCSDGTAMGLVPPEQIECDKFPCADCTCRRSWSDNTTRADCSARGLQALPQIAALRQINASNNLIETIEFKDLPQTLLFLDLQNNRVARLDEAVARALFAVPERRVQLSGNPIICGCQNKPFLQALRDHQTQVEDFNNITCAEDEKKLDNVDLDELCRK